MNKLIMLIKAEIKNKERLISLARESGYVGCIASLQRSILELETAIHQVHAIDLKKGRKSRLKILSGQDKKIDADIKKLRKGTLKIL